MIQVGLFVLAAAFFLGIVGVGLHKPLEGIVYGLLTGSVSVTGFVGSWKVLTGLLLLLVIPLGGLVSVLLIYYGDNPEKRLRLIEGSKRLVTSLVLISISFFLYELLLSFTSSFSELALWFATGGSESFREGVFYQPYVASGISFWDLANGEVASKAVLDIFKTGVYTTSLMFLIGTLAFQRLITRFGVILLPLALFMYNLPFESLEDWSLNILKGLLLVLMIPFLNILFLTISGAMPNNTQIGEVTHVLSFLVVALINWGIIKGVILDAFNSSRNPQPFKHLAKAYRPQPDKKSDSTDKDQEGSGKKYYRSPVREKNSINYRPKEGE